LIVELLLGFETQQQFNHTRRRAEGGRRMAAEAG
jgi:hypothetical protein